MSSVGGLGGGAGTNLKSTTGLPDNPVATVRQERDHPRTARHRLNVGLEALKKSNPQLQDINGLKPGHAGKDNVTGKEHYWVGKTMAEAEIQAAVKNDEM